jgi:hypothetical protein
LPFTAPAVYWCKQTPGTIGTRGRKASKITRKCASAASRSNPTLESASSRCRARKARCLGGNEREAQRLWKRWLARVSACRNVRFTSDPRRIISIARTSRCMSRHGPRRRSRSLDGHSRRTSLDVGMYSSISRAIQGPVTALPSNHSWIVMSHSLPSLENDDDCAACTAQ